MTDNSEPKKIPVIAVCTDEATHLKNWIECVGKLRTEKVEALPCVADNGSSDKTAGILWKAIDSELIERENVLWLHENKGFPAAQNLLIKMLGAKNCYKWFATLNIDAHAKEDWLEKLYLATESLDEKDKVGMLGGPIIDTEDENTISSCGHVLRDDGAFLDIDRGYPATCTECHHQRKDAQFQPFSPCFAASLWSFEMIADVGLPNGQQFLYYDDVEVAYKARINGWNAKFVNDAIAYHPIPNSKRSVDSQRRLQRRGQLIIVHRYLPDEIRRQLTFSLSEDDKKIVEKIDSKQLKPYGENEKRNELYNYWKNKHI